MEISDGTVYPILRKMKTEGLVTSYLSEESGGPPRKYYSLTKEGRLKFLSEKQEWLEFAKEITKILTAEVLEDE